MHQLILKFPLAALLILSAAFLTFSQDQTKRNDRPQEAKAPPAQRREDNKKPPDPTHYSYEFTKALSEIISTGNSAIEITRQPSNGQQIVTSSEIVFDATESSILDKVANTFAINAEPQNVTLIGEVTLLSRLRSPDELSRVIRLNIADGADIRKARVRLSAEQYEQAIEAHHREASLRVSGRLEREGNLYWLYNAEDVSVVENEEFTTASDHDVVAPSTDAPDLFSFLENGEES